MKLCYILVLCCFGWGLESQVSNPFDIPGNSKEHPVDPIESQLLVDPLLDSTVEQAVESSLLINESSGLSETSTNDVTIQANPFDITGGQRNQEVGVTTITDKTPVDKGISSTPLRKNIDTRLIVLVFVIVMLIILSLAITMDRKRCIDVFKSTINSNSLKTLYRENNAWTNGQTILFYLCFFLIVSFLIWLLFIKTYGGSSIHLGWIALGLLGCYLVRHITIWLIGAIYPLGPEVGQYNYSIMLHNVVLSMLLLPLILAVEFVPGVSVKTYVYMVGAIVLLVYLIRQVKGILSCISMRGFNPLYFFIYLCAVEIAPVMVFYKIIVGAI